jgi:sugar lactone lactonase YvrE
MTTARSLVLVLMMTAAAGSAAWATEARRWVADTADELLDGRGDGVAVTEQGTLAPVAAWTEAVIMDEPVVAAGGRMSDGSLIVGTGHPARLYRIDGGGARLLTELPGEQVTAVLVTPEDEVYAASLSPGMLFRLEGDDVEEVARLGEGGIWDLAWFADTVVAAAGSPAALHRLGPRGMERWVEIPDAHARSLAVTSDRLIVGSSGKGLVLAVRPSGQLALLADSPFTEIPDLVAAPDGSIWAVALVGEPVQAATPPEAAEDEGADKQSSSTSTVDLDLPKIDGATAASELLRLTPEGALLQIHRFGKQVASAIAWDGSGVLVGTGYQGEVWRFLDDGGARVASVDAVQVAAMIDGGAALLTQGPGQVLWRRDRVREARYRADGKSFPIPVRFGEYRVVSAGEGVRIRFRSGASEKPDESWLPWTEWLPGAGGTVPLPPARSLQWELELDAGSSVDRIEIALREVNLAPRIGELSVEEPGVVYLASPPPAGPVIDRDHPDVAGYFSVIDPEGGAANNGAKGKKYYRTGYRTVSWSVKDLNEDALLFRLEVEREDGFLLLVRDQLDVDQLAVDTTALPDGRYRFRLTASDGPTNPGDALSATRSSAWLVVDNTPPTASLTRQGELWAIVVEDGGSAVSRVEWSRDGARWKELAPADGILDGQRESFSLPAASGRHVLAVRAVDRHHNRTTVGAVEE